MEEETVVSAALEGEEETLEALGDAGKSKGEGDDATAVPVINE
jgi:hypothetical protein